jgi:hypothetical protein
VKPQKNGLKNRELAVTGQRKITSKLPNKNTLFYQAMSVDFMILTNKI